MSAPDYRYLQAWARPSASKTSSSASKPKRLYDSSTSYEAVLPTTDGDTATPATHAQDKNVQQQSAYQVRLDTPGGISYAPDALAQHNSVKRLFIPATMHDREAKEYDFAREIEARKQKATTAKEEPELDEQGRTQAQAYKASVEQQQGSDPASSAEVKPFEIPASTEPAAQESGVEAKGGDAASIMTNATATSVQSKMTTLTLTAERTQTLPVNVSANAVATAFRAPPSITGDAATARTPWAATSSWTSHRALDRLTDKEKKLGITQFEQATEGRVPSAYEASLFPTQSDGATIKTVRRHAGELLVEDLFVPDPRPWRPLRYVRKVDPRQMLILCAGAALTPGQVAAMKLGSDASSILTTDTSATGFGASDAASMYSSVPTDFSVQATRKAMFGAGKLPDYKSLEAQLKTSSPVAQGAEEKRAGLGFVYCPTHDARARHPSYKRSPDIAVEPNFSRRLERPPELCHSTVRRAALRAALAALEFTKWECEGFDKLVIATHHAWLVDGISRWIWEWRHNQWRLMAESPLGLVGEQVPDRDLWELLDKAVRAYEQIDCTVRFWKVSKEHNAAAVQLAQEGACKDNQQPGTVRWTKKKVLSSV
ncbi:uncharacterized protein SRS1_11930 [Sporisorium reilianum f. sp. reilianum]|uniref:RNase H type-1 domain-containing protein n=1 Tax=Sporisorium reilianum f. sp. reilianum TaxID=72559 RepID=A0A2N8U7M4_9BASI|nr:uncharacterized protein SRS1_11930 [Sporisorium reilianum f. sp. reilianum]